MENAAGFDFTPREIIKDATNARDVIPVLFRILTAIDESLANSIKAEYEPLGYGLRDVSMYSKSSGSAWVVKLLPEDSVEHPFWATSTLQLQIELVTTINERCPEGTHLSGTARNPKGMGFWTEKSESEDE